MNNIIKWIIISSMIVSFIGITMSYYINIWSSVNLSTLIICFFMFLGAGMFNEIENIKMRKLLR